MAQNESKGAGDFGKHQRQVPSTFPPGKEPAPATGSNRGDTVTKSSSGPPELPPQFGRYRVMKKLGGGGMGTVYLVQNTELEREEALKVPHFGDGDDPQLRERFLREARSAAKLDHANLCPVYDAGVQDGIYYLTMRFLKGKLLSDYTGKAQPARKAVEIVTKLAQALEAAHAKGVIHRDLKPSNVMMVGGVGPVVMDFGLAKQVQQADHKLTQAGSVLGTPAYMPPEQVNGDLERMGPQSDVYSLGVILYELLTGSLPFEGTMAAIFGQILYTEAPLPSAVVQGLNPALDGICGKAMAKASTDRYPSMKGFAAVLMDFLRSTPATDGAGNLVPTARDKAAVFQAPTAAPSPRPGSKADIFQTPTVVPQARSTLPPRKTGAKAPSTIHKPEGSRQTLPAARGADDEGGRKRGASFGTMLVRMIVFMLALGGVVGAGWLTYTLIQKPGQTSAPVAEQKPSTPSSEADSKPAPTTPAASKSPSRPAAPKSVNPKRGAPRPANPTPAADQEFTQDGIKYDMDHLKKGFGLKLNAVKLQPGPTEGQTQITLTLEFARDFSTELIRIRKAFAGQPVGLGAGRRAVLRCYFFGEDGVVFLKQLPGPIEGDVSAKKGDAFRITQTLPDTDLARTKKISFRMEPSQ